MSGFLEMMILPVVMAIVLVAMHSHLGFHVVKRGVIFVDIALAQIAAFGVAVSLLLGGEPGSGLTYAIALGSTFLGALLISTTRTRGRRVPQEAYIGVIYVVFSAAMILILTQVPHGGEEINHLLVGSLLWVSWATFLKTTLLYLVLGVLLWLWRGPLRRISTDPEGARKEGLSVRRWDVVFYMILGTVVTSSVQIAGVLLVFTLLVIPTVMGMRLFPGLGKQMFYTLAIGIAAVILGSATSYVLDLPTGAAIVCAFGLLMGLQVMVEGIIGHQSL
ncbi:MAG: metal ABC transporter permease [Candidatus Krumholzibacteria bacterium]|nr:metal ABC transporter permease [Candidatus Krumholzibacteria bacterium]